MASPKNRESTTIIEAISATRRVIDPLIILSTVSLVRGYIVREIPTFRDYNVVVTDTSYLNDELA